MVMRGKKYVERVVELMDKKGYFITEAQVKDVVRYPTGYTIRVEFIIDEASDND